MKDEIINLDSYLQDRQDYVIGKERLEQMETFHERTRYHPATVLNKSIKVGLYMTLKFYVAQTVNNFKSYSLSKKIELPKPSIESLEMPFSKLLKKRKSYREFSRQEMSIQTLSDLLFGAAGVSRTETIDDFPEYQMKKRFYPSAGNLFPIEVYPILLGVEGQPKCITHYNANKHQLDIIDSDINPEQVINALSDFETCGPGYAKNLSVVIVLTSVFQRSMVKYEERGYRFSLLEAGILGHNFCLASSALGLGSLTWGAYYDSMLDELLKVDGVNETTVNCLLIGNPRSDRE